MNRRRRPWMAYALAAICTLAVSCSTSAPSERPARESRANVDVPPSMEIRPYLVESSAGLILKARSGDWHKVRPLVEDLLAGELEDRSPVERTGPAANRPQDSTEALLNLYGNLAGYEVDLDHIDTDRALYLVLTPHRHQPTQGCLSAGLPCTLLSAPGPRYGRFLIPTDDPKALIGEIRQKVDTGLYLAVPHRKYVRVEFATSPGAGADLEEIANHLELRTLDRPVDLFDRRTPARSALIDSESPFGVYVNLRSAIDAAMYLEQWDLYQRAQDWSPATRLRNVLDATVAIGRLTNLDAADLSETEDISLLVDGDGGGGYTMDLVSTRTTLGRQLASVGTIDASLPEVTVDDPALTLEWRLQLDAIDDLQQPADWVTRATGPHRDVLGDIGGWGLIGLLRTPTAVALKLGRVLEARTGGFALDRVLAGRLQFSRIDPEADGIGGLRGGGALLLASGDASEQLVSWFRSISRATGQLETDIHRKSDGKIEVRFGLQMAVAEAVATDADPTPVDRFAVRADTDVARRLVGTIFGDRLSASESSINRVVSAFAERGTVRLSHQGSRDWYSARVGIDREPGVPLSVRPVEFSTRQPRPVCLDSVARMTGDVIEDALAAPGTDGYLADQLSSQVARFRNAIADCGGGGIGETELANWAVDYFNGWHALVDYRAGNDRWANRLLQVCEEGHDWACDAPTGQWPWLGPSEATGETARRE